jgi:hypothetical protein
MEVPPLIVVDILAARLLLSGKGARFPAIRRLFNHVLSGVKKLSVEKAIFGLSFG